ncbi:MAG TPA: type II toxin-antitoxin system RelE/ParE family toxin [Mycobacterium sp.]|jgi:mRNA interferase RelE/StbE|nr:type II toxin-antitoxin system RelE/ParE family toxin [Rhodoglobus sp.]HPY25046.1 type II toxin-antitoxin system RelE/ParE family toxin [Mycobacterium sp.]
MWEILYLARAEKALRKLDQQTARRIRDGLNRLAQLDDPTTPCKALSGPLTGLWRYRVGDYRVILDIDRGNVAIVAIDLGHRSEIYG